MILENLLNYSVKEFQHCHLPCIEKSGIPALWGVENVKPLKYFVSPGLGEVAEEKRRRRLLSKV